jgi:hypothetical protein
MDMKGLLVTLVAALLVGACQTTTTPVDEFCREAGPLLSREDFGPDPEAAVNEQMSELSQLVELLPDDQQEPVLELIGDLRQQIQAFEDGQAADGWRSQTVVEHVGSLCDRDDLVWHGVIE